jgi:Tfp pilus assembly protein PilV
MINKIKKQLKGFTLVETLIAVLLLSTAIAGPLTIASKSLIAALVAKNQVAAFFLAQDAIEFVRFARDTNKLQDNDWLTADGNVSTATNLANCLAAVNADGCYFDSTVQNPTRVEACSSTACKPPFSSASLYLYESNGNYTYDSGGTKTVFVREVIITEVVPDAEASIVVRVHWSDAGKVRKVEVRENIFNWQ